MIKIQIFDTEVTIDLERTIRDSDAIWRCETDPVLAQMLNLLTSVRPIVVSDRRPELTIAEYVVEYHKDDGAKIIFDSEDGKPPQEIDEDAIIY